MKCYWCGGPLDSHDKCPRCGQEVALYKKILRISNSCYNRGLEFAKVRNLSSAIFWLQRSLKWNKNNTPARNLLGVIYYEIGDAADALEEWTISASLQREDNEAFHYLSLISARQARVDNITKVIHKYNLALSYIHEDSEDLAILQAKQILNRNAHHVKAHLLLALLYMKKQSYAKAERVLRKVLRIDAGNVTALRYLSELQEVAKQKKLRAQKKKQELILPQSGEEESPYQDDVLIPAYRETTGSWRVVFLMVMGVLIGIVSTFFLIFPARERSLREEANAAQKEYFASLNQLRQEIEHLEGGADAWKQEKEALLAQIETYVQAGAEQKEEMEKFDQLLTVYGYKFAGDDFHAMETLKQIDPQGELSEQFLSSYQALVAEYSTEGANRLCSSSITLCAQGQFETARDHLLMVLEWNGNYPEAIYHLGLCYWNLSDQKTAVTYFNRMVTEYPDHELTVEAQKLLAQAGQ